jgi:hypothetical protein
LASASSPRLLGQITRQHGEGWPRDCRDRYDACRRSPDAGATPQHHRGGPAGTRRAAAPIFHDMTRRKGKITLPDIQRHWPHHVAVSADKVRGVMNSQIVWSFAETLSAAPRPYSLRCDDGEFSGVRLYKAGRRGGVRRAVRWGAVGREAAIESERAIPWATTFRTLPHSQLEPLEHAMLRCVASYQCSPVSLTLPRRTSQRVGVLPPTTPCAPI